MLSIKRPSCTVTCMKAVSTCSLFVLQPIVIVTSSWYPTCHLFPLGSIKHLPDPSASGPPQRRCSLSQIVLSQCTASGPSHRRSSIGLPLLLANGIQSVSCSPMDSGCSGIVQSQRCWLLCWLHPPPPHQTKINHRSYNVTTGQTCHLFLFLNKKINLSLY